VKRKAIPLLVLSIVVALLPSVAWAEGADVVQGPFPYPAVLVYEDGVCTAEHVPWAAVLWFHEDPPPGGFASESLVEGALITLPNAAQPFAIPTGMPDIWQFHGDGVPAYVYFCEDLTEFLDGNGVFKPEEMGFFPAFFAADPGLRDRADLDYTRFHYTYMLTDSLYKGSLSARGDHLDFYIRVVAPANGNANYEWRFEWN
jgi:hypothetical protein